jgi:hypothetical protein
MRRAAAAASLTAAALTAGCAEQGYSVVATTATSIGLEIGQAPATQAPQFVLGYKRAEYAFVPTNRPSNAKTQTGNDGVNGADRSADVLMELRYGGGAGTQVDTSIYQRVAVGRTAVSQPGAALLFAKGSDGEISVQAARAAAAFAAAAGAADVVRGAAIDRVMACVTRPDGTLDRPRLARLIALATEEGGGAAFTVIGLRRPPDEVRAEIAATPAAAERLDAERAAAGCPGA